MFERRRAWIDLRVIVPVSKSVVQWGRGERGLFVLVGVQVEVEMSIVLVGEYVLDEYWGRVLVVVVVVLVRAEGWR